MFDRFARNCRDSIMYKEMLKEEGIKVLSALEPITGKLFCGHCGTEMVADGGTSKTVRNITTIFVKNVVAVNATKNVNTKIILNYTLLLA